MSDKVKVAMSQDFLNAFAKLPRNIQGRTTDFLNKFRNDPTSPGINLEKLNAVIDKKLCSARINDTYRCIIARDEASSTYIVLWVDHHDEAYAWAARRRCAMNPNTGTVQIYQVEEAVTTGGGEVTNAAALFASITDEALLKLGVPQEQLAYVRSLTSVEEFYKAEVSLPKDAYEYLAWLNEGVPLEEVLELAEAERPKLPCDTDIGTALITPASMKSFVVIDGEEELRRIMAAPLEQWRVFLHPEQRKLVARNFKGPARVLGGAGTGKTVVAMHRAKMLAGKCKPQERILFTTFTANLAADIKENLKKICTVEELRKIEVVHLDAWVNKFLRESGFGARIAYDEEINPLWQEAIATAYTGSGFDAKFFEEEWNRVVIVQEALTLEKYVKAARNGRGTRLNRKTKLQIWEVFAAYQNLLKEKQLRDINTAMYECTKLLHNAGGTTRYAHIIVDEGQDFSDNAYRLLAALSGTEHDNDIFIVGDAHQRIYRNKPILSRAGINVRGRSSTLKINYRTTEEIRKYALALLNGIAFDDLDDAADLDDRCQSLMHGAKPQLEHFNDASEEIDFIAKEIALLAGNGVALADICIVARTKRLIEDYIAQLTSAGIRSYAIKRNKVDDRSLDGVRVATMHRVKGLEFQYVFVAAVNNRIVPLYNAINRNDAVTEAESIVSEKCLLYVALTRAQKAAYITSYGVRSEFL